MLHLYNNRKSRNGPKTTTPTNEAPERRHQNFGSKKMNDYMMGSRNLRVFPVGMSLIAR